MTEDEARDTARRVYTRNSGLSSAKIGKAIGRSRQTVDAYLTDFRAATQLDMNIKIFRMNRPGLPQDRIAKKLGQTRDVIRDHLGEMPVLAFPPNADLSQGFTVAQLAEKHGWTEPMVWSMALDNKDDLQRFQELRWGVRTWDLWDWNNCDKRFGDERPGRIPAQMIAYILFCFSKQENLILDPMAGGGVTPDT